MANTILVFAFCIELNGQTAPFTVKSNLFDQTKPDHLGLSVAKGTETSIVYKPTPTSDHYSNAVAMVGFKNQIYCQWQSSAVNEDSEDTWVAFSRSSDGLTWSAPAVLAASPTDGYRNTGGWWVNGDTLVAFINHWPSALSPRGGYAEYTTSTDGVKWSAIKRVKMADGSFMNAIFEQDPHALPSGRIINAAHFQPGLTASPIYTDDKSGVKGWVRPAFTNMTYSGDVTREIEPSWFYKNDGSIVMIFRDQNSSFVKLAAQSTDQGKTWTTPVLTDMPDSRSKQSAGNLFDGTAFMVNNPVNNKTRIPLVITLSKDGQLFDKAYLIRSGGSDLPTQLYTGTAKTIGYSYPKSMVYQGYLYVGYSVNKEEVHCSRIPLASLTQNTNCSAGYFDNCNVCVGGTTGLEACTGSVEAELTCSTSGLVLETKNAGFLGESYVNADNAVGISVSWVLESPSVQTATISFRYANGGTTSRDGEISLNGKVVGTLLLPPTGSWTTWKIASVKISVVSGKNSLSLKSTSADGLANLDVLFLSGDVMEGNCVITGMEERSNSSLIFFPNPTKGIVKFNLPADWELFNTIGTMLLSEKQSTSVDLSNYSEGVYILKVEGVTYKIVKK